MPKKRIPNFNYNVVTIKVHQYYKAYVRNADEKTVIVYGKTIEELCQKVDDAQHLAGHKNSKVTMDIYAKVKYNKPEQLSAVVNEALEK